MAIPTLGEKTISRIPLLGKTDKESIDLGDVKSRIPLLRNIKMQEKQEEEEDTVLSAELKDVITPPKGMFNFSFDSGMDISETTQAAIIEPVEAPKPKEGKPFEFKVGEGLTDEELPLAEKTLQEFLAKAKEEEGFLPALTSKETASIQRWEYEKANKEIGRLIVLSKQRDLTSEEQVKFDNALNDQSELLMDLTFGAVGGLKITKEAVKVVEKGFMKRMVARLKTAFGKNPDDLLEEAKVILREEVEKSKKLAVKEADEVATPAAKITREVAETDRQALLKEVEELKAERIVARDVAAGVEPDLNTQVFKRVRDRLEIKNVKTAPVNKLATYIDEIKRLQKGDRYLTSKQIDGLESYLKAFDDPLLVTKREIQERFAQREESFARSFTGRSIPRSIMPTVDIKAESAIIRRIVDKADELLRGGTKVASARLQVFDDIMGAAEKGKNKFKVNTKIFKALSGEETKLTKPEEAAVTFLKDYFKQAKEDLGLTRYRKNYIANLDAKFLERLKKNEWNLIKTLQETARAAGRKTDVPLDVMLNLDNIVGSKKFFRFALERKGGSTPTMNLRRILADYSQLVETKKALDKVLPEGQAAVQLLLQKKDAQWLAKFLQNIKGRGLDYQSRTNNPLLHKTVDTFVDFNYWKLLAGNVWSGLKNLVGGEVNSFVYQTFKEYATGKKRIALNPVKSSKVISESGILEGSYLEYAKGSMPKRVGKIAQKTAFVPMSAAEYEIRGSMFLGEMTEAEWKAGKVSPKRFREILDKVAKTQGVYTPVDSPLFVQTSMGRAALQFGRWKITNLSLARTVATGARMEWSKGVYLGKNTRSLLKMMSTYAVGTYLSYELAKSGNKQAQKVVDAGRELVSLLNPVSIPNEVMSAISKNPSIQTSKEILFSLQNLQAYIFGTQKPQSLEFNRGIEETYVSFLHQFGGKTKDTKKKSKATTKTGLPTLPKLPGLPKLK